MSDALGKVQEKLQHLGRCSRLKRQVARAKHRGPKYRSHSDVQLPQYRRDGMVVPQRAEPER